MLFWFSRPIRRGMNPGSQKPAALSACRIEPLEGRVFLHAGHEGPEPVAAGAGTGLLAQYFNDATFTNLALTRTDPAIRFKWGRQSPAPGQLNPDNFAVRWTGQVQAPVTGRYTFNLKADDGVQVWFGGQLVADRMAPTARRGGKIRFQQDLTAGQLYDLRVDYVDRRGPAAVALTWKAKSLKRERGAIPTARLYPPPPVVDPPPVDPPPVDPPPVDPPPVDPPPVDPPPVDPPPVDPPPVDPPPVDTTATITWTQVAPLPVPRSEHMGAAVNGKLYVFGGYVDLTFKPTRRSDVYDPATNAWTRVADLPVGVTHSGTVVDATTSSVYFAGGYPETATFQRYATAAVYRYDTAANAFTTLPSLPAARGGGALALLGRELHYFGGSDANRADAADHWALDLDNAAAGWSGRAPLPVARNHVGGVAVGGKLYAVGGQQGQNDDSVFRSELDVYDPATNAWTTLAPLPNPPRSHITNGTMVWNGQILTFGGETNGHQVITNVSSYNPATNTWTTPSNLPAGRLSGVADLLSPNTVIFAGGSSSTGLQSTVWLGQIT